MTVYASVLEMIGHTPLVELSRLAAARDLKPRLLAKVEAANPGGSVKDRAALAMLRAALDDGRIDRDTVVIEPTSGNTGVGLALVGAVLGLRVIIVMPASMSAERRALIAAYGARLELTPATAGMRGAIVRAEELHAATPNSFIPQQFDNPANPRAHYAATGPEIYAAVDGRIDYFVAGVGTGGTLCGVGRYLKERRGQIRVIGVEPAGSPVLTGGRPGTHRIQGIGAGFVPANFDRAVVDRIVTVDDADAAQAARDLARREGLFTGFSGGAALCAAVRIAREDADPGHTVVAVLPDSGDRYLSTALFAP